MQNDLISRSALLKDVEDWHDSLGGTMNPADWGIQNVLQSVMDNIIEAEGVDAVPVVRCGECKHFCQYAQGFAPRVENADGDCYIRLVHSDAHPQFSAVRKNDYCSMGARMDGGAEG